MLDRILDDAVVLVYLSVLAVVALYGFHRYLLVYLYLKHRHENYQPKSEFNELPRVTVQLPMYNEREVAERIIDAACAIDYPLEKFEIQVLDDSTDDSGRIAREACEKWIAKGYPVKYIHRENRKGYKAGGAGRGVAEGVGRVHRDIRRGFRSAAGHPL